MWIVGFGDALTSIYAGCTVFATLGYMAHQLHTDVSDVAVKGMLAINEATC